MTRRLIVTGVDGFVGRHVAHLAARGGFDVTGISRSASVGGSLTEDLAHYVSADLRREWPSSAPADAAVVHLAGLAAVGPSFDRPQDYLDGNSAMVTNLCEARLRTGSAARIVGVSTGAVYAQNDRDPARVETDPVGFTSPYVVSKVLVENQLAYYRRRGLDTVVARPFNHIGPGQGPGFIVPDLLDQLSSVPAGHPLRVGNLATRRDYTDVRDVAAAYLALASAPSLAHDLYNVASGAARSGMDLLEMLTAARGIPLPELEVDPSRIRANDPEVIVGDASRLRNELGWRPRISLSTTISDVIAARR